MRKLLVLFVGLLMVLLVGGTASATLFTDTVYLDRFLSGVGTTAWQHNTPADFTIPPDQLVSATLSIYAYGVNTYNEKVYVETNYVGKLDTNFLWFIEQTNFNIGGVFSSGWAGGKLDVSLDYDESGWLLEWLGADNLTLDKSVFTLNYNNVAVPEPATMFLLGFGLLGLAGFRKRFKK